MGFDRSTKEKYRQRACGKLQKSVQAGWKICVGTGTCHCLYLYISYQIGKVVYTKYYSPVNQGYSEMERKVNYLLLLTTHCLLVAITQTDVKQGRTARLINARMGCQIPVPYHAGIEQGREHRWHCPWHQHWMGEPTPVLMGK